MTGGGPPGEDPARSSPSVGTHLLLLASVAIWGTTFVAMKVALEHVSPFELVGLRLLVGLPVLALVLRIRRVPLRFDRRDLRPLAAGAGIVIVHFLIQPFALSLPKSTATNTGWIIAFSPLGIVILSRVLLGEAIRPRQLAGIAIATLGVLVLVSGGDVSGLGWIESAGDWLILVSAFTWAVYTIATRDLSRRRGPLAVTLVVFLPLAVACLAGMALLSEWGRFAGLPRDAVLAVLFLGVLGTLAQWFWQIGVARLGASRAGFYVYLEPLATTAAAIPLLGEPFGPATAVGGGLLLSGVWWAERRGRRGHPE